MSNFDAWVSGLFDGECKQLITYNGDGQYSIAKFVFDELSKSLLTISSSDLYALLLSARIGAYESGDLRTLEIIHRVRENNPQFEQMFKRLDC